MTAYQFAYFTYYQFFEAVSLDKASAWKASVVIAVVDTWIILFVTVWLGVLDFFERHSTFSVVMLGVVLPSINYHIFDHEDRWKRYATRFQKYSARELLVGRILVGLFTVLCFVVLMITMVLTRAPRPS